MAFSSKSNKTPAKTTSSNSYGLNLVNNISQKHEELKKIENYDISSSCIDVLHALLNLTEKDVEKCISKIENKLLKEKFLIFTKEYYYKTCMFDDI